mgnify:CR=1 FL=1
MVSKSRTPVSSSCPRRPAPRPAPLTSPGGRGAINLRKFVVGCDNSGAVAVGGSAASERQGLYLRRRSSFVQEAHERKEIKVVQVSSDENKADILTKVLPVKQFKKLRNVLMNLATSVKQVAAHVHEFVIKLRDSLAGVFHT